MSAFFSGTDTATLREEGDCRNHFVSLIVNNAGSYTAAITRKVDFVKNITAHYKYKTFNDELIDDSVDYEETTTEIQWFYLNIEKEAFDYVSLDKRLEELKSKAQKPVFQSYIPNKPYINTYSSPITNSQKDSKKDTQTRIDWKEYGWENYGYDDDNWYDTPYTSTMKSGADFNTTKEIPSSEVEKEADLIAKQLITTSVVCLNAETLDLQSWAKNLPKLWEARFADRKTAYEAFDEYSEAMLEFYFSALEATPGLEDAKVSAVATELVVLLSGLEDNYYIKTLLTLCDNYII